MGFGISSIASSSLGDRKKGYPKRQALWELTLALGRFPFDFVFFFFRIVVFFIVVHGFLLILIDFLWILVLVVLIFLDFEDLENMCRLTFHLSLSFYFAGEFC